MHNFYCLLILLTFAMNSYQAFADPNSKAQENMAAQLAACSKNTAMEWSNKLNRCVGKEAARETRNDSKSCNELTDITAKEKCHLALAEKTTGLSADTGQLSQGGTSKSLLLNGAIAAAYGIITLVNQKSLPGMFSGCTSKKILAITATAGILSDVYLKVSAKKKVKELEGKYALEKNSSSYESQLRALEYLKEEQETVIKIASLEKKRNMALMLGYGMAAGFALAEIAFPPASGPCSKPTKEAGENSASTEKVGETVNSGTTDTGEIYLGAEPNNSVGPLLPN